MASSVPVATAVCRTEADRSGSASSAADRFPAYRCVWRSIVKVITEWRVRVCATLGAEHAGYFGAIRRRKRWAWGILLAKWVLGVPNNPGGALVLLA